MHEVCDRFGIFNRITSAKQGQNPCAELVRSLKQYPEYVILPPRMESESCIYG